MGWRRAPQSNSDDSDRWIESKLTPNAESLDREARRFADFDLRWATFAGAAMGGDEGAISGFVSEATLPPSKCSKESPLAAVLTRMTVDAGDAITDATGA